MAKFNTRARAVDMLGRQQIAGVANAISELFKNAYDAYADKVEVDYFRSDGLFVLRDDGVGMTKEDFLERWLTIGTESKLISDQGIKRPYEDIKKPPRIIIGEKGIGRLAIAIIGPQVLIFSRAKREDGLKDLVAAFIHWGLFEAPGVNLDDIEIPVVTFPGGNLPSVKNVADMVKVVRQNTLELSRKKSIDKILAKKIFSDLQKFKPGLEELASALNSPSLAGKGTGTHFYISPANETIQEDLECDLDPNIQELSKLSKLLVGFTNTMSPGKEVIPIKSTVRYWKTDDSPQTLISEDDFWTAEEMGKADHRFTGQFDENGQFVGTVRIYDKTYTNHVIPAPINFRSGTLCGPFQIDFSYVMGNLSESLLTPDEFALFRRKLRRIGGLYIYKDGIRILPYGDADFDYLEMEKRRNLGAGYYFFAYRRVFGVIRLSANLNGQLVEKAGREGFQENRAYREFRQVLINFFNQLAADFFRERASDSYFREHQEEIKRISEARKKQEQEANKKRKEFGRLLESFFDRIQNLEPSGDVSSIIGTLKMSLDGAMGSASQNNLIDAEAAAVHSVSRLRDSYKIERPAEIGLTRELNRDWTAYEDEYQKLEEKVFVPAEKRIKAAVREAADRMKIILDERKRAERLLGDTINESKEIIELNVGETREALFNLQNKINKLIKEAQEDFGKVSSVVEKEIRELNFSLRSNDSIDQQRLRWKEQVRETVQSYSEQLSFLRKQLDNINWSRGENGLLIGNAEMTAALEEEVIGLRETLDISLEAAHLGKAVEVISHEFGQSIISIRENIRRLKSWADLNPELYHLYDEIHVSFDHLEDYLKLFTPLQRRLQRTRVEIKGSEIRKYIKNLFGDRLMRESIVLKTTEEFNETILFGFRSTFYPVFINLVDNAIFWLRDQKEPKEIVLDVRNSDILITDTGPGVAPRDRRAVFERGFTRKPGGQGLGLYISKETLKKEGYELILGDTDLDNQIGATFIIRKINS
jgi:signal transduction histidine kinase